MDKRISLVIVVAILMLVCACILLGPPGKRNSVASIAWRHRVSGADVEAVAHAYGIKPEDLGTYGQRPFPVNYIEYRLGWQWDQPEKPTVYRGEIDALMTGYVTKCDLADTATAYLFYSDWLSPSLWRGHALPVVVGYELDITLDGIRPDQVVQDITYYSLSDSGGWLWDQVAPHCDPPARY
jgi:hypothetical protein